MKRIFRWLFGAKKEVSKKTENKPITRNTIGIGSKYEEIKTRQYQSEPYLDLAFLNSISPSADYVSNQSGASFEDGFGGGHFSGGGYSGDWHDSSSSSHDSSSDYGSYDSGYSYDSSSSID